MLKVGITGGIGSGKTTICRIFETMGIPIYYADDRAKWMMTKDEPLVNAIKNLLGNEAYLEDGALNRPFIASKVFKDKALLAKLNSIVHPAVFIDSIEWHKSQKEVPYTLKEAALLFESRSYKLLDKIITVFAPKEMRIERVMKRDGVKREDVEARIDKQMPDKEKIELADFVINNDGSQSLIQQVIAIHQQLLTIKTPIEKSDQA